MPYRSVTHIDNAVSGSAGGPNAAFTTLIPLPEASWEGRPSHAVRIGGGAGRRIGVYFVGGLHAREWGSPDILTRLIEDVTKAYRTAQSVTFGSRVFTADEVRQVVEGLNLYVFPQANPDGRQHSMTTDAGWRKNRRPDPNPSNVGVDINRNFDCLWHYPTFFSAAAPVVSSTNPAAEIYIGPSAESEPETRNIVSIIDGSPEIRFFVDVHSFSQKVLYGWGDDQMQTADPAQSFGNAAFDGQRGVKNDAYGEFIPAPDLALEQELGNRIRDGIVAAGGPAYVVQSSFDLYPTSGTSTERAFMRNFVDRGKGKVHSYTIEWGTQFQPPWSEMAGIVEQVCAGLLEFCLGILAKHSDVYIRDNATDDGSTFTNNPFWESPDLVVRRADDGVFAHEDPITGQDNFLYVRVTNRGPNVTGPLKVSARAVAYAGTEFLYPHDWTAADATHLAAAPIADTFDGVAVGDTRIAKFRLTAAQVDQLGAWKANGWHPCLLAEVDCVTDFAASGGNHVWDANNLAQRNISVVQAVAGQVIKFAFLVGHELNVAKAISLDVDLGEARHRPKVRLDLVDEVVRFPAAHSRGLLTRRRAVERPVIDLVDRVTAIDLTREPNRLDQAVLTFTVPDKAAVGEVYRVRVAQRNAKGRVVGGVTLEVPVVDKT